MIFKELKKILYYLIVLGLSYSQCDEFNTELSLDLHIVNSGKYSLSSFMDPTINLWIVNVTSDYGGNERKDLRFEVNMKKDGQKVIWGVSKPKEFTDKYTGESFTNMNFVGTDLAAFEYEDNFYNEVLTSGVLPAGQYTLEINAWILDDFFDENGTQNTNNNSDIYIDDFAMEIRCSTTGICPEMKATACKTLQNLNTDERVVLLSPDNGSEIYESNPFFRWESPGFGYESTSGINGGIETEYRLIVALFNPELHSSLEDALNDETSIYFDSGWDPDLISLEIGTPQPISKQYPATERELSCGYQYCWRVEARESIPTDENEYFPFDGTGIWGWPEPAKSDEIYSFYYGSSLSTEQINSPGSYVNTVMPTFSFSNVLCADSYEIWLGDVNDPEINNPIWKSDYFTNTNYQYPTSANGLSPGETYYWKIRVNPETTPGPWSNIFSFTVTDISFLSPGNQETINTLFPVFNISSPTDISQYQLLISDSNDPEVNESNILLQNIDFFPYDFPLNNETMLNPGKTYYWKIQTVDDSGVLTKLINENINISSFSIKPIELTFPNNGSYNISLRPLFSWEGPIGVDNYIIEFTNEYDTEFNDIILNVNISNPFFLSSNLSSNLPFDNGTTYLWRVKPIHNGIEGEPSQYFSFSTILDDSDLNTFSEETGNYDQINFETVLTGLEGKDINVIINNGIEEADTYLIQLSDDSNMANIIEETSLEYGASMNFSGENLEWGNDYYIQVIAYSNNQIIGEPSNIKMIIMPFEPGSQDQVSFSMELINSINPSLIIDITNPVTNANNYILRLSESADMSNLILSELINTTAQYIYEDYDDLLSFGTTYYCQLVPLKDNQLYGMTSNIQNIFIPNIIPPQPSDTPFYFEHSSPQATSYIIEISTTEDFAVVFFNDIIESNNITIPDDTFSPGTPYYWRIRGRNNEGTPFGEYSNPKYFISSGEAEIIDEVNESNSTIVLESPENSSILSTKNPLFSWVSYEDAEKYEIIVSKDLELTNIVWNSQNIFSNNTAYPTSGSESLEYNTPYYWTIRPISNNIYLSGFSEPYSFSISSNFIPELTAPLGNAEELKPYFSWTKIQNATRYGLVLSLTEDYSNVIYNNTNINENFFQYPDDAPILSYDTKYFWKVMAISEDGSSLGDYSNTANFITPNGIIKLEFIFGNE